MAYLYLYNFAVVQSTVSYLLKDSNPLELEWKSPGSSSSLKYCWRRGSNCCPQAWELGTLPLDQLWLTFPSHRYSLQNLFNAPYTWYKPLECTNYKFTLQYIVLKMFQRLRSVEHGWADSTTFSQLSFVKIKVYESWPTWRKAPHRHF